MTRAAISTHTAKIKRLHAKQRALDVARADAEREFLATLADELAAGRMSRVDLETPFSQVHPYVSKDFHRRWGAVMPVSMVSVASPIRNRLKQEARNIPNGTDGTYWEGRSPLNPGDPVPLRGIPVVYVLHDADDAIVYIGSTDFLSRRLSTHRREGKPFIRWTAYPCRDREAAYQMEYDMIRENLPFLNKRLA